MAKGTSYERKAKAWKTKTPEQKKQTQQREEKQLAKRNAQYHEFVKSAKGKK